MYALKAFQLFKHPKKEFIVIGTVGQEIKDLLQNENIADVVFKGNVSNTELSIYYSNAQVFVISSIEEGLAMVQGEALACGCPIIATANTGSADLFTDGKEGFIVPIRSENAILEKFNQFADDKELRNTMSANALLRVKEIGGWDAYGSSVLDLINGMAKA